ncbi:MAG: 4Fe-4S binding protein [Ruminococcaceae bacterium]|nr:4Fe-4S binding protein [Oscillospiraceae bacterium]
MEVNTIEKTPHDLCTGCFACMNTCPIDAVKAESDSQGFLCPVIDKSKCVSCGKCAKVCPILREKKETDFYEPKCYAAWSKDENVRFQSTSGGVFTHLAEAVIEDGGTVVGARYKSNRLVEHALIRKKEEIEQLRQSKYVQSEIGLVFREIAKELKNGKPLLFAGTPCQCAGLKAFLEKDYENLFLCDFICRGVNSPLAYSKYLEELEDRYGSKVKQVWFKNKTFGWSNFATKIVFEDGREYIANRETDPFMLGYIKTRTTLYMRESCYQCRFKGTSRPVDITLSDFWGAEKAMPNINIFNGVSAVMTHSKKGESLVECVDSVLYLNSCSLSDIIQGNPCINQSAALSSAEDRNCFFNKLAKGEYFSQVLKNYNFGGSHEK